MARDRVIGTNRDDTLREGPQASSDIFGLRGNDQIFLVRDDDLGGDNVVVAGPGNDTVVNRCECDNRVNLGPGDDTYASDGFALSVGGVDQVRGGPGNDTFAVATFHSLYAGEGGNDTFVSIGWQNAFFGGAGRDTISYAFRHEDTTIGDTPVFVDLVAGKVFTGAQRFERVDGIENVIGSIHGDEMLGNAAANRLDGGDGDDAIVGGGGNDVVIGGDGDDQLAGQQGNDHIDGGPGSDLLIGGPGRDVLIGGGGRDEMRGEAGADTFVFAAAADSSPAAPDVIVGFSRLEGDRIDLRAIDADTGAAGDQAFVFIADRPFTGSSGELRFRDGLLQGDTDGDGAAEFMVLLDGAPQLLVADIAL